MIDLSSLQKGAVERPPRIMLIGVPKIGKSTFAARFPTPVFLPIRGEEGVDDIGPDRFPTLNSFEEVIAALASLQSDTEHDTVVIDSLTTLEKMVWEAVCREHSVKNIEEVLKGYGKGFTCALAYWQKIQEWMDYLRSIGKASIVICHVSTKTWNDPLDDPYDKYVVALHKAAEVQLVAWVDACWFARRKKAVRQIKDGAGPKAKTVASRAIDIDEGKPVLLTQERAAHPGGGRGAWGHLPYELPFDYAAVMDAYVKIAIPTFREYQKGEKDNGTAS